MNTGKTIAIAFVASSILITTQAAASEPGTEFLQLIDVPSIDAPARRSEPLVVAIVDDGIRLTHQDIAPFVWSNAGEVPDNGIDDDGNGFVDDVNGYDVADDNNDVLPPAHRNDLYHGTHIAGVVAQIARAAYGDAAAERVRIMPVKAMSDDEPLGYVRSGYEGVTYAMDQGADVIITAWSVGQIDRDEERVLERAAERGILIVASTGNVDEERSQYPAAHDAVIAVGSTKSDGRKTEKSNYGQFVDISAPGNQVRGAGIEADDSYRVDDGTSFSAAMVGAAAALLKLEQPEFSAKEVEACLMSSSTPIPVERKDRKGKLGAGNLNVRAALACDIMVADSTDQASLTLPRGFVRAQRRRGAPLAWAIEPDGEFAGIRFYPVADRDNSTDGRVEFRGEPSPDAKVLKSYALDEPPAEVYVPGSRAYVSFEPRRKRRRVDWLLEYEAETIDFSTLYCSGTTELSVEGVLTDGSGDNDYSAKSDCKWLITAPPGKVILFEFDEIDTEPRTDMIYFFNGAGTHEQIMAIFSGQELPPELPTWGNQVFVWFVSNGQIEGGGWKARYRFVDPKQ